MIEEPHNLTDPTSADAATHAAATSSELSVADSLRESAAEQRSADEGPAEQEPAQQSASTPPGPPQQAEVESAETTSPPESDASSEPVAAESRPVAEAADEPAPETADTAEPDPAAPVAPADELAEVAVDEIDEDDVDEETADEDDEAEDDDLSGGAIEEAEEEPEPVDMDWYILKVQSNRERSIAEALQRKIAIEGLDRFFGQVIVPTEKVTEFKGGKKKIVERKLWPGYIVVNMHINDDTWFAVRETSGIGDFTGAAGKPTPMQAHEVAKIIQKEEDQSEEAPKLAIKFKSGDKVKIKEGNFINFEGEVGTIDEASGRVTVMINIFGRSTPVELEYWQIESA